MRCSAQEPFAQEHSQKPKKAELHSKNVSAEEITPNKSVAFLGLGRTRKLPENQFNVEMKEALQRIWF